jgi:hypothetical protein
MTAVSQASQQVRSLLVETEYLVRLHGSMLFVLSAMIPLYPLGRQVIAPERPLQEPGRYTRARVEALIVLAALGVAALFLPLHARLLVAALDALRGGEAS